jgi:hypothetical protein
MNKRKLHMRRGHGATWLAGLSVAAMSGLVSGCVKDSDCGVCDPDNLILQSLTGVNYTNKKVHVLSPECEGDACPSPFTEGQYFIEDIGPCEETEEATGSSRPEEYCLISPMITFGGIEFVFNNLLDPTSVELVRKRPDNPQLFEVYDWKSQVASIRGPQSRFNGDYLRGSGDTPDTMARAINLSCIENLAAMGQDFGVDDVGTDVCEKVVEQGGNLVPLKMQFEATMGSYRGETDWRAGSCDTPEEGADTCCTVCDYELSVNVYKYGTNDAGAGNPERIRPGAGAITCDATGAGDKFRPAGADGGCKGFIPYVERETEPRTYAYEFNGEMTHAIPRYDKIRETHPDDRPADLEHSRANCQTSQDCVTAGLKGAECVGEYETSGGACSQDGAEACINRHCIAEWFVECVADANTTGGDTGFCVDTRFKDRGAGACWVAEKGFDRVDPETGQATNVPSGQRLANCDGNDNGFMTNAECCQTSLGGGDGAMGEFCDPIYSQIANLHPVGRFDRNQQLPEETRDCFCGDPANQRDECRPLIEQFCTEWGDAERHDGKSNEGQYITRFVSKNGGVVYDPSLKGVDWRPGDLGAEPRALVESCAESQGEIGERNIMDGWRAGDGKGYETRENFDRALCSGQEYELVFSNSEDGEHIVDKVGNTLDDKEVYKFRTPQFHVVPGSGFPTDNLRIGACDNFEISVSNKFDMAPENLRKIELHEIQFDGAKDGCTDNEGDPECWVSRRVVAGGLSCAESAEDVTEDAPPCLTVDVGDQWLGTVRIGIDTVEFGKRLYEEGDTDLFGEETTGRYRMVVPGLGKYTSLEDLAKDHAASSDKFNEIYQAAFHDACGMPLITAGYDGEKDFLYDFSIDSPKCKEDKDNDGVQLSCDNAGKNYNPDQADADKDGFGDVVDLCVVTPSQTNTADSDKDGIGNDCDNCRQQADNYNENVMDAGVPAYMWVRNIPFQFDADQDGIGDACDNCPAVANCENYGPNNPWNVNDPIDPENSNICQTDDNNDMIGDLDAPGCGGSMEMLPGAAGPAGFGMDDDFDQDGIVNLDDYCPRIPVEAVACQDDSDCGDGGSCEDSGNNQGVCNHRDTDGDKVGNTCDTCPFDPNFAQTQDGGMQEDDEDGDFVGFACETNAKCYIRKDPRPYAFYEVANEGMCCTTVYPGDGQYDLDNPNDDGTYPCLGLCDPDGLPIQVDCQNEPEDAEDRIPDGVNCRQLPAAVLDQPGVVELPPGCEDALVDAGKAADGSDNARLTLLDDFNGDEVAMWNSMCFLPQWDQDFDGIGDACELKPSCEFAFDPNAEPYVDQNGKVWPDNGKYCSGDYDIEQVCAKQQPGGGGETGTGTGGETGESGGTGDTGGN